MIASTAYAAHRAAAAARHFTLRFGRSVRSMLVHGNRVAAASKESGVVYAEPSYLHSRGAEEQSKPKMLSRTGSSGGDVSPRTNQRE